MMPARQSERRFVDFVREIEGKLTDGERRELDAWREHFRDGGDGSPGVRVPVGPRPSDGPAETLRDLRTHVGGGLFVKPLGYIHPEDRR